MKTSFFLTHLLIIPLWFTGNAQINMPRNPSDSIRVMKMICEGSHYQWIGTNIGLILRDIKTGKELLLTKANSVLPSNEITCGVCLPDGQTYIGTKKGIVYCDNHSLVRIDSENSDLPEDHIKDLMLDQKNNVWVKTFSGREGQITGRNVTMLKTVKPVSGSHGTNVHSPFKTTDSSQDSPQNDLSYFTRLLP